MRNLIKKNIKFHILVFSINKKIIVWEIKINKYQILFFKLKIWNNVLFVILFVANKNIF